MSRTAGKSAPRAAPLLAVRRRAERLAAADAQPRRLVFGEGSPRARLLVVGEAPGATEEREGRPFVGRAGRLLDDLLGQAGLARGDIWITNVVKVRPTAGAGPGLRNRPPTAGAVKAWLPVLDEEIATLDPALLLGLGAYAGRALVGPGFRLGRDGGRWLEGRHGRPCVVTFHPAFILRQQGEALAEARRAAGTAFAAARERLALLTRERG